MLSNSFSKLIAGKRVRLLEETEPGIDRLDSAAEELRRAFHNDRKLLRGEFLLLEIVSLLFELRQSVDQNVRILRKDFADDFIVVDAQLAQVTHDRRQITLQVQLNYFVRNLAFLPLGKIDPKTNELGQKRGIVDVRSKVEGRLKIRFDPSPRSFFAGNVDGLPAIQLFLQIVQLAEFFVEKSFVPIDEDVVVVVVVVVVDVVIRRGEYLFRVSFIR